jgi:histidinol phosphatase-like enzyme
MMTIAIDFDGVLASYDGWKGQEHYGAPLPGALGFVKSLAEAGYQVVIFTTRAGTSAGIDRLEGWLKFHGLTDELIERLVITCIKPPAWLYIDDRCFLFKGAYPSLEEIENFKPWWKE